MKLATERVTRLSDSVPPLLMKAFAEHIRRFFLIS
jgi:hypothetical protein